MGKTVGGRVAERGQWGGAKNGGGKGVGRVVGKGGLGEALIEVLNKTGIITLSLVIGMHITRQNWPTIAIFGGIPQFWREFPCNDIIVSPIRHNLTRKVQKRDVREIS